MCSLQAMKCFFRVPFCVISADLLMFSPILLSFRKRRHSQSLLIQSFHDLFIFFRKSGKKRLRIFKFATTQKFGHCRCLLIQPLKSEIGAYALQRMNGTESFFRIPCGKRRLQFGKAAVLCEKAEETLQHFFVPAEPRKYFFGIRSGNIVYLSQFTHRSSLLSLFALSLSQSAGRCSAVSAGRPSHRHQYIRECPLQTDLPS